MITLQSLHLTACVQCFFLPPVNCSDPTPPVDGSIDPYHNTTEGAEIFFRCNPGFVPAALMTAVCGADGRWNPNPAGLVCTCESSTTVYVYTELLLVLFLGAFATEESLGTRLYNYMLILHVEGGKCKILFQDVL